MHTERSSNDRPRVLVIGGPDVDARIELILTLQADYAFLVAGTSGLSERFAEVSVPYHRYRMRRGAAPIGDTRALAELTRLCRTHRPDLVHTFDTKPSALGRLAARLAKVPVIVGTIPGLGSLFVEDTLSIRLIRLFYERVQRAACAGSTMTVFQNPEDREQFINARIVSSARSTVIPGSGVPTDRFRPLQPGDPALHELLRELSVSSDEVIVTLVSRVIRSKGVLGFAEASEMVRAHHPKARFLLVGPIDAESVDRLSSSELDRLARRVELLGERRDVHLLLAASDVFVLPTFSREGIPRVLLEAAATGLPMVTTDSPGCNQVVQEGANGFFVPARDASALASAIALLVRDPALRERFGKASRERAVARFDLSIIAEMHDRLYRSLLDPGVGVP